MSLRILCLGDVVGRPGRQILHQKLPNLVRERAVDLVVANAENIAGGSGITANLFNKIRSYGVDVVTLGDHIYRKADIVPTLQSSERIVRPANLSNAAAGRRYTVVTSNSGISVGVFSLLGRIYMNVPADDPFAAADWILLDMPESVRVTVCDMHAEATSEKVAMGHWLDGRCSMIVGTHTHIPTADGRVLPGGTAYITDVGMTGPRGGVIGVKREQAVEALVTQMSIRFETSEEDPWLNGVVIRCSTPLRADSIEQVLMPRPSAPPAA
jgi:metallophosphoesterase (TIGR00282 family)